MTAPLIAYADRFSARPGERIEVKVSSQLDTPYRANLMRIVHADPNPAGPGIKMHEIAAPFAGEYASRFQPAHSGSCGIVHCPMPLELPAQATLSVHVQPWLLDGRPQAVLALSGGLTLSITPAGAALEIGGARCAVQAPMVERRWYELRVILDAGEARLLQIPLQLGWAIGDAGEATMQGSIGLTDTILFAAAFTPSPGPHDDPYRAFFNGRIEDPMIHAGIEPSGAVIARWDFSADIPTQRLTDRGPLGLDGRTRNLPTRAVRGSRWSGAEMNWQHRPRDYAAIHFHEDDLYDCGWQTDFAFDIPADMPSGVYGIRLRAADTEDIVPVYVLPPRGTTRSPVAFLASTYTYQVYGNHARGTTDEAYRARRTEWGAYPHNADEHPEYGRSTYNKHIDGSGFCYSSMRRPLLTMRPGYLTFNDKRGSGLRHFPADSHLTDWLEANGIAFDVLTDHDLDREGVELLRDYRAVVTGSHPEYHTPNTLNALQDYVNGGGRLAYLGGNGFYWRVANSMAVPDVLEIRRAEGGIRSWAAEPGEYYHALDGGYGGLWRRNGRPPQMLAGVGFSAQGLFEGSYYRRLPASHDQRAAWIFEGVSEGILGDFGLSGGGAAGFELDRADRHLGTPPNALILARSEQHQPHHIAVPEELLSHTATITGEKPADLIRAEIVYFETANGGAVFSTGSITFCGSLSHNSYDNPVSRMLRNVMRRFAAP